MGWRVFAVLVGLAGCSGRAEPAMDSMQSDANHRPGSQQPVKSHDVVPLPEEPGSPDSLPP
jgi:hypothetical protein